MTGPRAVPLDPTFEQQVAAVLRDASREWARAAYMEGDFPRWLAPRVAAAIEAAAGAAYRAGVDPLNAIEDSAEDAALAVLRGAVSGGPDR